MTRTRVKICGITRPEDALVAAAAGADAIGLVFYPPSPRYVDVGRARAILQGLPPFVTRVGLFVNAPPGEVTAALNSLSLDMLQFHGDETRADCERYGRPYMKAVTMSEDIDLYEKAQSYASASAVLLDAHVEGLHGGTGVTFNWDRVPPDLGMPVVLAGGLTPDNVSLAIHQVRPYAVDVSGGVESSRGIKDADRVRAFISAVGSGL